MERSLSFQTRILSSPNSSGRPRSGIPSFQAPGNVLGPPAVLGDRMGTAATKGEIKNSTAARGSAYSTKNRVLQKSLRQDGERHRLSTKKRAKNLKKLSLFACEKNAMRLLLGVALPSTRAMATLIRVKRLHVPVLLSNIARGGDRRLKNRLKSALVVTG